MSRTAAGRKRTARPTADDIDDIDGLSFYPQYCFRLSPTVNTYPHLRASDIDALTTHSGFGGQNVFFHLNHPIQWVRVAGVVVAVDEYPGRRIYTLDDSSGVCIECLVDVPRTDAGLAAALTVASNADGRKAAAGSTHAAAAAASSATAPPKPTVPPEVDVGTVVDVKGGLALFRGHKQIRILKATVLGATEHEVAFWEKAARFRRDVLEVPWRLTDREVRRCRKEEERRN